MSIIHTPREPAWDAKSVVYLGAVGVAFVVFVLRLWYVQVVQAEELVLRTESQRQASIPKLAPRGLIYDRNGKLLAGVKPEMVVTAVPRTVQNNKWVIAKIAKLLGADEKKLWDKVDDANWRPYLPTPIFVGVPIEIATKIAESTDLLPGIGVESQPMRVFQNTVDFAHILGYVWTPNDKDVERLEALGIVPADYVGKQGLEQQYEQYLMGKPGKETVEIDAKGRPVRVVARDNAVPGDKLTLTIDSGLQKLANELLKGRRAAAVALDPKTGEVLCMASAPTYDTALFQGGISKADWEALRNDEEHPLINRADMSAYAPGSSFKIVTTLSAAAAGVFSETRREYCPGYITVGNAKPKCLGVHGSIAYFDALARSCNTFFGNWAMKTGSETLQKTALSAGLGAETGIDLPSEASGIVPTAEWYASSKHPKRWYTGDTVNLGIGQGELAVTPLQMACLVSLVANDGVSYRPHLLKSRLQAGLNAKPEPTAQVELARVDQPSWVWSDLKRALVGVIEHGTARVCQIPGIIWAGKTGSAEHRRRELTHSWFVGFAPADDPKIAVAVLVESAGHGSDVAAPIARDIVKAYLTRSRNSPNVASNRAASSSALPADSNSPEAR